MLSKQQKNIQKIYKKFKNIDNEMINYFLFLN